jgi:hypothetical protein
VALENIPRALAICPDWNASKPRLAHCFAELSRALEDDVNGQQVWQPVLIVKRANNPATINVEAEAVSGFKTRTGKIQRPGKGILHAGGRTLSGTPNRFYIQPVSISVKSVCPVHVSMSNVAHWRFDL